MNSFHNDNAGQVSAELIIVIAALLAVAAVMVKQLTSTASKGSGQIEKRSTDAIDALDGLASATPTA